MHDCRPHRQSHFFRALKMVWGLNAWIGSQIVNSVEPSGPISLGKEFAVRQVLVESPAKGAESGTHLAAHRN
jgi:hypothetical protein